MVPYNTGSRFVKSQAFEITPGFVEWINRELAKIFFTISFEFADLIESSKIVTVPDGNKIKKIFLPKTPFFC